ncbi:MAG: hypothetical protein HYV96_14455 [Opitutae bacterium]|nr:hypothetical protein [Opitutae bacterium]
MRARGCKVRRFWARGGYTPLFSGAKSLLRRFRPGALPVPGKSAQRERQMSSPTLRRLWLTLAMLDLFLCYVLWLRICRFLGYAVLCDRYLEDTALDFRRNFPHDRTESWWLWWALVRATPTPDAAFLLLIPVDESLRRSAAKNEPFPDTPETLAWRLRSYEELAATGMWRRLDGRAPREEVQRQIQTTLGLCD